MTSPRSTQVSLDVTPYYHCMSRCVRRAHLCGFDKNTGKDFDYRRQWIEDRILHLSQYFCIDVPSYAVMSNHFHVILHVDKDYAENLTDKEVAQRWSNICEPDELILACLEKGSKSLEYQEKIDKKIALIRERLFSISWFMRILNQNIAARCNSEDKVTGSFWASRFKSQALLTESAVIACMAYVDLNPIRAKIAKTINESTHTSLKKRIDRQEHLEKPIAFIGQERGRQVKDFSLTLKDYIQLVKWTAINIHKKTIEDNVTTQNSSAILKKHHINSTYWISMCRQFEDIFQIFVGPEIHMMKACSHFSKNRIRKAKNCKKHFNLII